MKVIATIILLTLTALLSWGSEPVLDYEIERGELRVTTLHEFSETSKKIHFIGIVYKERIVFSYSAFGEEKTEFHPVHNLSVEFDLDDESGELKRLELYRADENPYYEAIVMGEDRLKFDSGKMFEFEKGVKLHFNREANKSE